jgi:methylmalonyl-CoA mutase N-terminal domain/subunit
VNAYAEPEERRISVLKIKGAVEKKQVQRLKQRKKSRNAKKVASVLSQLAGTAEANNDLMPAVMNAVRAQSTVGEICEVFRRVYGEYREAVSL